MDTMTADFVGPLGGHCKSSSGHPRYVFVAVDQASRYLITCITKDTSDASILQALTHMRAVLRGFPRRIQVDNAMLTSKSDSLKFLKERGVEVRHGLPYVSRCQAHAERAINTLTRLITKFYDDQPQVTFDTLVREATIVYNSSPNDAFPQGLAPKDLHFARPSSNFLRTAGDALPRPRGMKARKILGAARAAGHESLKFAVLQYMKRKATELPTKAPKLRVGDLCLRKRSVFPSSAPKKLSHKVNLDGYQIINRVATNSWRCKSVVDGSIYILPGDLLIKVKGFTKESLKSLVAAMEKAAAKTTAVKSRPKTRSQSKSNPPSIQQINLFQVAKIPSPCDPCDAVDLGESFFAAL